tara:strand:+ start:343 stop:588 length:246 start_codon:yes stop_codon:yes gene_type:complete
MKITEHKSVRGLGDEHHMIIINWFDRDWKILITDNGVQKITTVQLWETNKWINFLGRSSEEVAVYNAIINNEIVKLKYKVK